MTDPWKRKEIIGDCTLYLGDCMDLLPAIGSGLSLFTDPPYGIALKNHANGSNTKRPKRNYEISGDRSQELGQTVIDWAFENAENLVAFSDPALPWLGKWRSLLVFNKGGAVGGGGDTKTTWKQTWELIHVWNRHALTGGRDEAVLRFPMTPEMYSIHPTIKPVGLLSYLIAKIAPSGAVLDPFMGSGTTGVACAKGRRDFIGIEINEGFFEIACERIRNAYAQPDFFVQRQESKPVQEAFL